MSTEMNEVMRPKAIGDLKVALAGAGGVGGYCARALYSCGVRELRICDADVFQPKNNAYQFFASPRTLGCRKAETARRRLLQENGRPTRVTSFYQDLMRPEAVSRLIEGADLVISALDNFQAQAAVGRACEEARIPFAMIACVGFCLQHTVYGPDPPHTYSSAWKHFPRRGEESPRPGQKSPLDRMMQLQSVLYAALLAGYPERTIHGMLTHFRRTGITRFYNLAGTNYAAAALGVLNALRHAVQDPAAVTFPRVTVLDLKRLTSFDGPRIVTRIGELNRAWHRSDEAVLDCLRAWRPPQTEARPPNPTDADESFLVEAGAALFGRRGFEKFRAAGMAVWADAPLAADLLQSAVQSGIGTLRIGVSTAAEEAHWRRRLAEFTPTGTEVTCVPVNSRRCDDLLGDGLPAIACNLPPPRTEALRRACAARATDFIRTAVRGWGLLLHHAPAGHCTEADSRAEEVLLDRIFGACQPAPWAQSLIEMLAGVMTWQFTQTGLCADLARERFFLLDLYAMRACADTEAIKNVLSGNRSFETVPWQTLPIRMP
ncbi:MAG: ThiF family adenylyltransferase [Desulfosarcinaceae bacterium]